MSSSYIYQLHASPETKCSTSESQEIAVGLLGLRSRSSLQFLAFPAHFLDHLRSPRSASQKPLDLWDNSDVFYHKHMPVTVSRCFVWLFVSPERLLKWAVINVIFRVSHFHLGFVVFRCSRCESSAPPPCKDFLLNDPSGPSPHQTQHLPHWMNSTRRRKQSFM